MSSQPTGIAFHYDQPNQEAPQSILLAVAPKAVGTWDVHTLVGIVNETLDLAKMRMVDLESLAFLGHFLPAMYVAQNERGDTLSVNFRALADEARKRERI
jgi:hypothetical protein